MYDDDDDDYIEELPSSAETEKENRKITATPKRGRKPKPKSTDGFSSYAHDDIVQFISLVETYPLLWDGSCANSHRTNDVHIGIYNSIEEMCTRFMPRGKNTHGSVAKKIWADLVKAYNADVLKAQKSKSGSGSSTDNVFEYAHYMTFLNGAKHKRQVNNAYILGSADHFVSEHEDFQKKFAESVQNFEEELSMKTPKRKSGKEVKTTPKRRRATDNSGLLDRLERSNQEFSETLQQALAVSDAVACQSERVCKVFSQQVQGWDEVDKFMAEAQILNFIKTLTPSSSQTRSHFPMPTHSVASSSSSVPLQYDPSDISLFSDPNDFSYHDYQYQ